ncbi:MAG: DUF4097 family beta strand repeat protein, partial [Mucilaginibacter polytrichastri]|nr:DUF4097 family beta strand repeat protein [Mucilaginibacter polytrichastri]
VGAISVSNCDGDLELRSSTGALSLANTKGKAEAITSTGAISANNFNGELQAKTSTGSLQLSKISGSVEASSSTGSAKVSMAEIKDFVRVNVSVGSINLELPAKKGLDLDLSGRNVNVQSLANFDGKKEKNRIEGKLNGGGIPVEAKASIGSVTLDLQ